MKTTPSTLGPVEAYEALMLFAQRRGEGALRLAMHAAVPQSFRPDLLHLLKLNFLPRELHDPAAEADVLFSPLCEEVARGYFEFGPHVRTLLLDNLAANYALDPVPRISRVANFLIFYVEHMERRAAGGLDRIWRDYLEVQRWVALAFLDPDAAARQLAAALKGTNAVGGEFAARLRLGGLASALSSPLGKYRHVINYAAGLQALEAGDHDRAQTLLSGLGDAELDVGGVRLRPATELLRAYNVQRPEPPPTPEKAPEPEPSAAPPPKAKIYFSYSSRDREQVLKIAREVENTGHGVWMDASNIQIGEYWQEAIQAAIQEADIFIACLSRHSSESEYVLMEINYALQLAAERPEGDISIIPVLLEPCEIPEPLAAYHAVNMLAGEDGSRLASLINWRLEQRQNRDAGDEEREEKIRALEALAGSADSYSMETLTEAIWREEDSRVRLAAVSALGKSRGVMALEALLVACGDEDAEVRRAAAEALASSGVNAVLIFGFFGTDHVENREVLREELLNRGYVPLVFPYTLPPGRNPAEIVRAAAPLTRFAIADLTAPPEIREDLAAMLELFLSQTGLPLIPIHQGVLLSKLPIELQEKFPSVLSLYSYAGPGELRESFDRIVTEPLKAMLDEARPEPKAQLPSFTEDIFISYAHMDNQPLFEGDEGWVNTLHKGLNTRVGQLMGREVKIWRDTKPRGNDVFDDNRGELFSKVALLVVVFTPGYVRSGWCLSELRAFIESASAHGGLIFNGRSRIFKLLKTPVEHQPEELRELIGYEFFERDRDGGGVREFRPMVRPSSDERYWNRFEYLAQDIASTLRDVKYRTGPGGPSEAA